MNILWKKIPYKRILYILCFLAVNLIEFLKATQRGDVWYVAVNFTGLAIFALIASTFSRRELWNWWNLAVTVVCGAAMAGIYLYKRSPGAVYFHLGRMESAMLNVWWLLIAAAVFVRRILIEKTKKLRWSRRAVLWVVLMLFMILSVNDGWWPLWFFFMFGFFYLTDFTAQEKGWLLDSMIDGTVISFFVFQIYAYGTRPFDTVRYVGFYNNSNTMALYYLIVYGMVLCRLHSLHVRKGAAGWKLFYLIGAGGLLSFQIFTICRTAMVSSVVLTALYGLMVVHRLWGEKLWKVVGRGAILGLMVAATFLPVYYTIRWLPTLTHYRVWYPDEYSVDKVHSFDPPDSEKYIELDEFLEAFLGRLIKNIKSADAANPLRLTAHAQEWVEEEWVEMPGIPFLPDTSVKARLNFYRVYLRDMTWVGNTSDKGYYRFAGRYDSWHAQNLWIQIGYSYGIPAGLLSIVMTVVLLGYNGGLLLGGRNDPYAVIPFVVCVIFFMFGLTEVVWLPGQLTLFLMFFVQHPMFGYLQAEQIQCEDEISGGE